MKPIRYFRAFVDSWSLTLKHLLRRATRHRDFAETNQNPMSLRVTGALKLAPRGAVPNDILVVDRFSVQLHVQWFARGVHPWDRDLPSTRQAELFAKQCLEDVDAAIPRLFEQLPEVDVLEIVVLEPGSNIRIIGGTVHRKDLLEQSGSSVGMRLRTIGINYRRTNLRFEAIA